MAEHKFNIAPSRGCYAKGCRCDACREIKRKEQNAYRQRNPKCRLPEKSRPYNQPTEQRLAEIRQADRRRYHAKREQRLAVKRAYRSLHANRYKTWLARYSRSAKGRAANIAKQAKRRGATGLTTPSQLRARWDYYGGRCYLCGNPATETDHVIPISRGGTNWPSNLRPACQRCNRVKRHRKLGEFQI